MVLFLGHIVISNFLIFVNKSPYKWRKTFDCNCSDDKISEDVRAYGLSGTTIEEAENLPFVAYAIVPRKTYAHSKSFSIEIDVI
jgi:hypothetical protein